MGEGIERMTPETATAGMFWEHVRRYRFAAQWVRGKRVLDIACGAGYGSRALLEAGARSVIGVDISPDAVAHAREKYGVDARLGDGAAIPLPDASVDLVVSMETIEHLPEPARFLDECRRVLAPGGSIVVSTPNTRIYDPKGGTNPYHLSEMTEEQFLEVVRARFENVRLYSQTIMYAKPWSRYYLCARQSFPRRVLRRGLRDLSRVLPIRRLRDRVLDRPPAIDAVRAAVAPDGLIERLFDPAVVRRREPGTELPMYLLAVATKP